MAAVGRLPKGFLDEGYANGLAVAYVGWHDGRAVGSISCHKPSGSIKALSRQWSANSLEDGAAIVDTTPGMQAVYGAQELGEFAYFIYQRSRGTDSGVFDYSEFVVRFNQASYVEARYHHPFYGGGEVMYSLGGGSAFIEPYPENLFSLGQWNTALHVSDTFPPRLWYLSGDRMIHWIDSDDANQNQAPYAQRWRRREDALSTAPHLQGPWRIKFQGAHYLQRYITGSGVRGPVLVHPWANASTDPELWYFVARSGGGYNIYRASWRSGEWQLPPSPYTPQLESDDGFAVIEDHGDGTYPHLNPNGYAFEHDWHKESNFVGRFFGETRGTSLLGASIKIVRDARRIGRLYMIVAGGPSPSGYYGGSFFAVSEDDGGTWSRMRRLSPFPRTSGEGLLHGGAGDSMQGTVNRSGMVVVPGRGRYGGTSVRSLLTLNPNAGGVTSNRERPYVYKRGEASGSEWL